MSSSSTPESTGDEATRLALEEVEEAEALLEQQAPKAEAALGQAAARAGGRGWVTAALAAPGFLWLGFYLLAPLVIIILVSFWTRTDSGFDRVWTTANYSDLFHDPTYWHNMLTTFETSLIAVGACLLFGFPVAYFLALKVEASCNVSDNFEQARAAHMLARRQSLVDLPQSIG